MNKILASAYNTVTRGLYLHTALVALFLLIVISITVWTGNTLTMITAIARFERTHTVSRVEAMAAFYDYQNDQNPETLNLFYSKMAITQSYNKVFSRLLDMRKDTPDAEAARILESTFSETDHQTAVLIVNRIKVLHWHPILKELVADAVGAHAAGEAIKLQVAKFLATNDKVEQKAILTDIENTRKAFIAYETSFSKSCSVLSNQISSYVTYVTIAILIISVGFISLLTYRIARTVIQQMARDTLAVADSRRLYRNLVENTKDLVTRVDLEGRLVFVNHAALDIFGLAPEACIGRSAFDFIVSEDRKATEAAFASWLKTDEQILEFENRQIGVDGQIHTMAWLISAERDENGKKVGFASSARDNTERKNTEEAIRVNNQRFRDLVDSTDGIVWEADAVTFAFTSISGNAERLLGYQISDWFQPSFWADHLHPDDRENAIQYCVSCTGRLEDHDFEYRFLAKDGRAVWLRDIVKVLHKDGKPRWLRGLMLDISKQKLAEAENLRLLAQLQQSQKMESLGTLAGGVAHDMNNVLGAILGLASAHIDNQPYGSPLHQALDTICKATERGGKMVKSLLSFARQSPAESHRLDMNGILKEQVALLERTTLAKVRLHMDLEAELRPIQGDASALTHAFMNLCVNAVDAMPENGILTLHTRNVDNDWIEVEVEDNGMGMSKEVLEKAMDPFFTTKGTGKGTGLGLSMVFSTVNAHRGQMAIESQPDKGTRVLLRFPTCEHGTPVQAAAAAVVDATPPPHGALKVLLVDDDGLIQSSIQMLLEVLGHTAVTTAPSGEEALAVIEAGYEPDLVILDMNMPGLGGIGTLPRLRGLRPTVPILLSTGRVDQTALTLASTHPGVTLLSKPFGLKELQKHLESIGLG